MNRHTTALYHVTTECMSCGYEDVVGVPIVNIPEVRALVEAYKRLYDIAHFLTVEKIAQLGDDAMIAAGFGLDYDRLFEKYSRFERIDLGWAITALAPFEEEK